MGITAGPIMEGFCEELAKYYTHKELRTAPGRQQTCSLLLVNLSVCYFLQQDREFLRDLNFLCFHHRSMLAMEKEISERMENKRI